MIQSNGFSGNFAFYMLNQERFWIRSLAGSGSPSFDRHIRFAAKLINPESESYYVDVGSFGFMGDISHLHSQSITVKGSKFVLSFTRKVKVFVYVRD